MLPALPSNSPLKLVRRARKSSVRWRATVFVKTVVLKTGRAAMRQARRFAAWIEARQRPETFQLFSPAQLNRQNFVRELDSFAGFDRGAAQTRIGKYRSYYAFVPAGSPSSHLSTRFNHVDLMKTTGDVVLFPSSHPLLFNEDMRIFYYDKHHEIPYHSLTSHLQLKNFSFSNVVRPSFQILTNIYDVANVLELREDAIYIGGSFNYGHFFTDYLPRFEAIVAAAEADPKLDSELPKLVVTYCAEPEMAFLRRTFPAYSFINLFGFEYSVVRCRQLYMASFVSFPLGVHLLKSGLARRRVKAGARNATTASPLPKKVFLSREGFKRRRIANEQQISEMLEARGFTVVPAIKYSIEELEGMFQDVEIIVTGMGAHTVNAIFAKPGAKMVEITPASFDSNSIWQYNHSLFLSAELRYFRFVVPDADQSSRGGETSAGIFDWEGVVDLAAFKAYLDDIEAADADAAGDVVPATVLPADEVAPQPEPYTTIVN